MLPQLQLYLSGTALDVEVSLLQRIAARGSYRRARIDGVPWRVDTVDSHAAVQHTAASREVQARLNRGHYFGLPARVTRHTEQTLSKKSGPRGPGFDLAPIRGESALPPEEAK